MITWFLQFLLISASLYGVYALFLKNGTHFRINRYFLLGIVPAAALVSWVHGLTATGTLAGMQFQLPEVTPELRRFAEATDRRFIVSDLSSVAGGIYLLVAAFLLLRLFLSLVKIARIGAGKNREKYRSVTVILTDPGTASSSFGSSIFLPADIDPALKAVVLEHEYAHVRQGHSYDIVYSELCTALFFLNPFCLLISRELRKVHEYLADEAVIRAGTRSGDYQEALLFTSLEPDSFRFPSNFSGVSIKNRIHMMTKKRSAALSGWKALLALPAMIVSATAFTHAQDQQTKVPTAEVTQVQNDLVLPEFTGGQEAMISFLVENIRYPKIAVDKKIEGKVFYAFTVTSEGKIKNIRVQRGVDKTIDDEGMRVIATMPDWKPGTKNGKPVEMEMVLPVSFKL